MLLEFLLSHRKDVACLIENQAPAAGGSLIECEDVAVAHAVNFVKSTDKQRFYSGFHLMLQPKEGI